MFHAKTNSGHTYLIWYYVVNVNSGHAPSIIHLNMEHAKMDLNQEHHHDQCTLPFDHLSQDIEE